MSSDRKAMIVGVVMVLLAAFFGSIRPFLHPGNPDLVDTYKSMAHLYVGVCFGARYFGGNKPLGWIAWGLSILEGLCAILQRIL